VQRLVSEGENVTNGQVVALLDQTEWERETAMRRADAQAAEAVLAELEAGTRPEEIEQAAASLEIATAEALRMRNEFTRQKDLFQQKVIAPREFEAAEAAASMASAKVREGEARLALLRKGPREETIRAARARLEQARQAVALAETRLGYAVLMAPLTGVVLAEGIENGEYVVPGTPVVTVGDLLNVWLRAYVNETDLGRVKIGQTVRITTDTYPGKAYEGRLSFIAPQAEFTPKNVQTAKERVKLVYRIKVDIANPDQELKPGMPADADIKVR
jgi:HlyD family secretion protein